MKAFREKAAKLKDSAKRKLAHKVNAVKRNTGIRDVLTECVPFQEHLRKFVKALTAALTAHVAFVRTFCLVAEPPAKISSVLDLMGQMQAYVAETMTHFRAFEENWAAVLAATEELDRLRKSLAKEANYTARHQELEAAVQAAEENLAKVKERCVHHSVIELVSPVSPPFPVFPAPRRN